MKRYGYLILIVLVLFVVTGCAGKVVRFQAQETTVVDIETGLVWMKNANMPSKPLPWRADDNVYAFIQKLNKDNFAGYGDWRVPSKDEMKALILFAKDEGDYKAEKIETWPYQVLRKQGFLDVRDYGYWTSTRESSSEIFIADLATGKVEPRTEDKPYYLWPVRGGR